MNPKIQFLAATSIVLCLIGPGAPRAQRIIDLTLESTVAIAMDNSYRVRQLQMGVEQSRGWLKARQAGLKSRVYMNLTSPDFSAVSDYKWNSTLYRDEIVRQDTNRWEMDLIVEQPVILLGYPTDGYLSLNNKMRRYSQRSNGTRDINFYNRYFVRFRQPFFRFNNLKYNIDNAELDLKSTELDYINDLVRHIDSTADDYYDLFRLYYRVGIYKRHLETLTNIERLVTQKAAADTSRAIEAIQIQVEVANTRERLSGVQSDVRLETSALKQRLRLNPTDSLTLNPVTTITPISVDLDTAIQYGYTLRPQLRLLDISMRKNQYSLESTKSSNSFSMNLEMTYGTEKQDDRYQGLWEDQDNSYSMKLTAYIPIWDWGRRKAYIDAQKLTIDRTELSIEETQNSIRSEITNSVANLDEYQSRALTMQENSVMADELTTMSIEQYQEGRLTLQDLLQTVIRRRDTEMNFLDAYLGYRNSLLTLMRDTHYDFENNVSLIEKYGME